MVCNKDEAASTKCLAERKMVEKDFVGAKKIVEGQQLSKELDVVSERMLAVCDVHSAAGAKVNGEVDWYGILQVPVSADDAQIKKQFRKFALLLHPDKNKFAGAEDAFKLVGEANTTLTDRTKRSVYDVKRNTLVRDGVPKPSRHSPTRDSSFTVNQASNSEGLQQTFWTSCPYCSRRYQYSLSMALICQYCWRSFTAHDLKDQAVPSRTRPQSGGVWKNAGAPHYVPPSQPNAACKAACNSSTPGIHVDIGSDGKAPEQDKTKPACAPKHPAKASSTARQNVNRKREADWKAAEQDKMKPAWASKNPARTSSTARQKRGSRAAVDSVSSNFETTCDTEGIVEQGPAANSTRPGQQIHSSRRQRQEVKYNGESNKDNIEDGRRKDDDDGDENIASPPSLKRSRKGSLFHGDHRNETTKLSEDISGHNSTANCVSTEDKNKDGAPCGKKTFRGTQQKKRETMPAGEKSCGKENEFHSVRNNGPDPNNYDASDDDKFFTVEPEFFDFDQLRDESRFRPNQIWAVYDNDGCMPRFYAQITKVETTPNFIVHYIWLEFDAKNQMEAAWHKRGLPVACGRFKDGGSSETSNKTAMFSRIISFDKIEGRNLYEILPRKGEAWALFKGWYVSWNLNAENHREYVVQVLSDLTTSTRIIVMPLVKIKGFVSLFIKSKDAGRYVISQGETLRFSHCIPHHMMSGTEKGVPEGSLELDPSGLPPNFEECFPCVAPEFFLAKRQEGSMSAGERKDTRCMNTGSAAKTTKDESSKHKTTIC